MRFKKTGTEHTAGEMIETYELELRPGHTITREDHISRLGAGRKGRAAEVSMYRVLDCTCGGHLGYAGLSVKEDLEKLPHFESPAEKDAFEAKHNALRDAVLKSLGMDE